MFLSAGGINVCLKKNNIYSVRLLYCDFQKKNITGNKHGDFTLCREFPRKARVGKFQFLIGNRQNLLF